MYVISYIIGLHSLFCIYYVYIIYKYMHIFHTRMHVCGIKGMNIIYDCLCDLISLTHKHKHTHTHSQTHSHIISVIYC